MRWRVVGCEIELDPRAVGIEEKHLPWAGADLAPIRMLDAERRQIGQRVGETDGRERHVIDYAGFEIGAGTAADDVENRRSARIQPGARKIERRARTIAQPKQLAVETYGAGHVVGQDREVIHRGRGHRGILLWLK